MTQIASLPTIQNLSAANGAANSAAQSSDAGNLDFSEVLGATETPGAVVAANSAAPAARPLPTGKSGSVTGKTLPGDPQAGAKTSATEEDKEEDTTEIDAPAGVVLVPSSVPIALGPSVLLPTLPPTGTDLAVDTPAAAGPGSTGSNGSTSLDQSLIGALARPVAQAATLVDAAQQGAQTGAQPSVATETMSVPGGSAELAAIRAALALPQATLAAIEISPDPAAGTDAVDAGAIASQGAATPILTGAAETLRLRETTLSRMAAAVPGSVETATNTPVAAAAAAPVIGQQVDTPGDRRRDLQGDPAVLALGEDASGDAPVGEGAIASATGQARQNPSAVPVLAADLIAPGAAPSGSVTVSGAASVSAAPIAEGPQDFETLVSRIAEAREAASPQVVSTTLRHGEFGTVSMQFRHEDSALQVTMASADPDFSRSVQAAVAAGQSGAAGQSFQGSSSQQQSWQGQSTWQQQPGQGQSQLASGSGGEAGQNRQTQAARTVLAGTASSPPPGAESGTDRTGAASSRGGIYA